MAKFLRSVAIFTLAFFAHSLKSQNYTVLGSATTFGGCDCFRITPAANGQAGAIFQNQTINLNNSFDYTFSIFLGCNNGNGADGMMFVLTSNPNGLGNQGEGLGYAGQNQPFSFAVEFDTYQNNNVGDPSQHHIAFNSGGQYNHNVAGPVSAQPNGAPIDNCQSHVVRVVWDVNSNTFSVYFNGNLRLSAVIPNIVGTYFGGNPIVNWGWTAATGGRNNEQRVCIESISSWVAGVNYQSCSNTIQFTDVSTSNVGNIQSWAWTFGDGGTSTQQNPVHTYPGIGAYNVSLIITDISGCTKVYSRPVTIANNITLTPTLTPPPCNGGTNGSLSVTPSGGFGASAGYGGYSYSWSSGHAVQCACGVGAGTYTVTVTDGVCTTTGQYTLTQPPPLTASVSKTDASCGQNNGTATIVISGGTQPYSQVNWGSGYVGTTVTGLPPGVKIADFNDANGCSALLQYSVNIGNLPCGINSSISKTDVSCFGGNNGSVTLTVTGGAANPVITWSPGGQTGATASNLTAGTYTYSYSDNVPGNAFSGTITITQPGAAMLADLTTLTTSCAGTNDGEAIASVPSGGVPPYSYAWSGGGPNNPVRGNLSAGPVSVTITDSRGCTATANGSITGPPTLTLNITSVDDSCFQSGKGSASANPNGGTPPYTYFWNNISPAQTNLDLTSGTYLVTVTDSKGCTITGSATINQPSAVSYSISSQNINCFGNSTGSISISVSGGTPAYAYTWIPASVSGANPTALTAGKYFVTVSDLNNCSVADSVTLTQPDSALSASTSSTDVTCNGLDNGTITITTTGGTPPYTFLNNPLPVGTLTIPNLAPNTYAGNIVDANGCTFAVSETITQPAALVATEIHTNVSCFGANDGSITVDVTGGSPPFSFDWGGGIVSQNRNNLSPGSYSVVVTDANGCTVSVSVTITQPAEIILSTSVQHVDCHGNATGSVNLSANAGASALTYLWSNSSTSEDIDNLTAGVYCVTVTDVNNCTKSICDTVNQPQPLVAPTSKTDVTCFGLNNGTITVNISGGTAPYTFLGNPLPAGVTTIPNLFPNTYAGLLTDANGCTLPLSETITEPAQLTATETHLDASCFGAQDASIDVIPAGGTPPYAYNWGGGVTSQNRSNIGAGSYTLTITDGNLCTTTLSITVNQPTSPPLDVTTVDAACFGANGSATASPTEGIPPYTFTWTNSSSNTATASLPAGSHSVTATASNGCSQVNTFVINQPTEIVIIETHTDVDCNGASSGSITLNVTGGTGSYTYNWLPNVSLSNIASNVSAGSYSITVTDGANCLVSISVAISEPALLSANASPTSTSCFGLSNGSINASATGGTPPFNFTATDGTNTFNSGNGIFSSLPAGSYTVLTTDNNGCTASTNTTVNQPAQLNVNTIANDASCYQRKDGSINATATGGTPAYNFTLSTGASNTNGLFTNLAAGTYNLTVTDNNSCIATATTGVTEPDPVEVTATPNPTETSLGNPVQLNITSNQSGTVNYLWVPSTGLSCNDCDNPIFDGISTITYTVYVSTSNGCEGTSELTATVVPDHTIFIPNAFSPNNDGSNDFWQVFGNLKAVKQFAVAVFNRWGEKVYESEDVNFRWDGYGSGGLMPAGVYVYTSKVVFIDNHTSDTYKGSLTILR